MQDPGVAVLTIVAGLDAGRQRVVRPGERVVLGRGAEADLPVIDERASREHVAVELASDGLWVVELGSRNGTLLDGRPLPAGSRSRVAAPVTLAIGAHAITVTPPLARAPAPMPHAVAPAAQVPAPPGGWPPPLLEVFEVTGALGRGGAGCVYAVRHRASGRALAVKVLAVNGAADPTLRERFLREARLLVLHPCVVALHDLQVGPSWAYLVMDLVLGRSLEDALLAAGPLPVAGVARVGAAVASGLSAAHAQGIVHRDVKPANVLLAQDGRALLADFGIARVLEGSSGLTASGVGLGTLDYVAPEQALDAKRATPASDLYALGATLYHALAGRPPLDSRAPDFPERLFTTLPPALARVRADCPRPLSDLVARLLEKHPDDRPASAAEVAAALRGLAG